MAGGPCQLRDQIPTYKIVDRDGFIRMSLNTTKVDASSMAILGIPAGALFARSKQDISEAIEML